MRRNAVALLALFIALGQPALADGFGAGYQFVRGLFGDGSVTAPGIAFSSDTDTGIYRSSGDIAFAVNGTQVFRTDSATGTVRATRGVSVTSGVLGTPASGQFSDFDGSNARYAVVGGGAFRFTNGGFGSAVLDIGNLGVLRYYSANPSGSGSAALGANFPGTTAATPYAWITARASDDTVIYIPAWK